MARFTGTFEGKVDDKGRASLPADFRDVLKKQDEVSFYVFPSPNLDCLEACDDKFMQRVEESIEEQADMFSEEEDGLTTSENSTFVARTVKYNVILTMDRIREKSPILAEMEDKGEIQIVGAVYSLHSGKVEMV